MYIKTESFPLYYSDHQEGGDYLSNQSKFLRIDMSCYSRLSQQHLIFRCVGRLCPDVKISYRGLNKDGHYYQLHGS